VDILEQGNPDSFIPGYSALSPEMKIRFWCELVIAIAWFESSWNPRSIYHEPPPLGVDSVGLLQLSYEDQDHYDLEHLDRQARRLEDPLVNLRCGVKILAKLVADNRVVERSEGKKYSGAARYWSVMRQGHHLEDIKAKVRQALGLAG
jgi:hypothetical protein